MNMRIKFKKITIIGTGFMGGSLAMAIKKEKITSSVWGLVRNKLREREVRKLKIFDKVTSDLTKALEKTDFVILATPISSIIEYIKILSSYIQKNCLVTDIGSTKEKILREAKKYLRDNFVGSHPLCGSEKKGAEYSIDSLFKNSLCVLTPIKKNESFQIIKNFWRRLGSHPVVLDEKTHDRIIAYTSGLPHILSFSLSYSLPYQASKFIGASFKDMTRISGSPPRVWTDIFLTNRFTEKSLQDFLKNIDKLSRLIEKKDKKRLSLLLNKIVQKHKKLIATY